MPWFEIIMCLFIVKFEKKIEIRWEYEYGKIKRVILKENLRVGIKNGWK